MKKEKSASFKSNWNEMNPIEKCAILIILGGMVIPFILSLTTALFMIIIFAISGVLAIVAAICVFDIIISILMSPLTLIKRFMNKEK